MILADMYDQETLLINDEKICDLYEKSDAEQVVDFYHQSQTDQDQR